MHNATEDPDSPVPKPISFDIRQELPVALPQVHTWSTPANRRSASYKQVCYKLVHTPLAQAVQDRAVLRTQSAFHNLELESGVFCCIVDAIHGEFICAVWAGVVPGVVAGGGSRICAATIHNADLVKAWVAVA